MRSDSEEASDGAGGRDGERHRPDVVIMDLAMRRRDGVDGFLTKPCLPEELEHHVQRLIGRPSHDAA